MIRRMRPRPRRSGASPTPQMQAHARKEALLKYLQMYKSRYITAEGEVFIPQGAYDPYIRVRATDIADLMAEGKIVRGRRGSRRSRYTYIALTTPVEVKEESKGPWAKRKEWIGEGKIPSYMKTK